MIWIKDFGIKIWDVKPAEKYVDLRASTSSKNKDGSWGASSNWFPRCVGKAAEQAGQFKRGDYVKVKRGYIANEPFEKDGVKKNVFKMTIIEFDQPEQKSQTDSNPVEGAADDLPY